ncbi:hypothetical protein F2Q69_00058552 [Brassica cretica]|uniref:Alpha/beta hydrolase fold-3 domain-containing protein n=1 Tax=Brassica cretica TaxID=69181 RepID=A0A8S9RK51_BRACR|nr:hypothetical protein F2Q69_00058552 [Brassica cretica]
MESTKKQLSLEVLPWLVVHSDGTLERLAGTLSLSITVQTVYKRLRLAPEHPLPTAYEDSWNALQGVQAGNEPWINDYADFNQFFLAGDSAGANISHHLAFRAKQSDHTVKIKGIGMIHPYFWGTQPVGSEVTDEARKQMVDGWWRFVCPSDKGSDDPWINPFADGSPNLEGLECERVIITVAERDILRERGKMYYEKLVNSNWRGNVEIMETKGKDHVFHIFEPNCDEAKEMVRRLALFINQVEA